MPALTGLWLIEELCKKGGLIKNSSKSKVLPLKNGYNQIKSEFLMRTHPRANGFRAKIVG